MLVDALNRVLNGEEEIPLEWRDARIRLIFKGKGCPRLFDSYRPIAITSILGKVVNSILKEKMLLHCRMHGIIDEGVQKGFMPKVSGCIDHIAAMMNVMRVAKTTKKSFYALLLDLKAAYDSVPHARLWKLLRHVGISEQIVNYLERLYTGAMMHVETKGFSTASVPYGKGVLQGDTLSPLLFTIYFMVVIRAGRRGIGKGFITGAGYVHHLKAFADDLNVVVKSLEELRETWRNLAEGLAWCQLEVNQEKCRIMWFEKGKMQMSPEGVNIADDFTVKCGVKEGAAFLGLEIDIADSPTKIAERLNERMTRELDKITACNYPLQAKLFFYETGVLAKFRWWFTIYERISIATVTALQQTAYRAFRSWAAFNDKFTGEVFTSQKAYGIEDLRHTHRVARSLLVLNLMKSTDPVIVDSARGRAEGRETGKDTEAQEEIQRFKYIANTATPPPDYPYSLQTKGDIRKEAASYMETKEKRELKGFGWCWSVEHLSGETGGIMKRVLRDLKEKTLRWELRALCNQLPTNARLSNMKVVEEESKFCPLCTARNPQTLRHVLNGCQYSLHAKRYNIRHDAVLRLIYDRLVLANKEREDVAVWVDLDGLDDARHFPPYIPTELADGYRPDILLTFREEGREKLVMIELTCPFEDMQNLQYAQSRKKQKYLTFKDAINATQAGRDVDIEVHCIEVGSRGFIANTIQSIYPYIQCSRREPSLKTFLESLSRESIQTSMKIFEMKDRR